jgi:hypothetical protein
MKLPHSKHASIVVVLGIAGRPPELGPLRAPECRRTRVAKDALSAPSSFVVRSADLSHALAAAPIWTPTLIAGPSQNVPWSVYRTPRKVGRNIPRGQRRLNSLL